MANQICVGKASASQLYSDWINKWRRGYGLGPVKIQDILEMEEWNMKVGFFPQSQSEYTLLILGLGDEMTQLKIRIIIKKNKLMEIVYRYNKNLRD